MPIHLIIQVVNRL